MKLLINYDFFNAIKNVNEKTHPLKIIRNEKTKYTLALPLYLSAILIVGQNQKLSVQDIIIPMLRGYGTLLSLDFIFETIAQKFSPSQMDLYALKSSEKLKELVILLKEINVRTNYDKLLTSELYYKTCNIEYNDGKLPDVVSKKYIYVPSYGFDGNEKMTSILQEHVIGTKEYVLSQDEPDKEYRRVLVKSHI